MVRPVFAAPVLILCAACAAPAPPAPAASAPPALDEDAPRPAARQAPEPPARQLDLPAGWPGLPAAEFEDALVRWNPSAEPGRLSSGARAELSAALAAGGATGVRAALLLAHSADPLGRETLLARLESRARPPAGAFPAADVVAAAALAASPDAERERTRERLSELVRGDRPHPVLVVRTECAISAMQLDQRGLSSFLLGLLREGTPAQASRPPWRRGEAPAGELEWAQRRAARALADRAGVPCPYRPEQSAADRARAADELEAALDRAAKRRP